MIMTDALLLLNPRKLRFPWRRDALSGASQEGFYNAERRGSHDGHGYH
jgi:hypothetical protein